MTSMQNTHEKHPIDELLAQQENDNQSEAWLLPYLDVFILLSMMFIILLILSNRNLTKTANDLSTEKQKVFLLEEQLEPFTNQLGYDKQKLILDYWRQQVHDTLVDLKIDNDISLALQDEFIELQIQDRMLFDSGLAELKTEGKTILKQLLPMLQKASGMIMVEGHTDNKPIKTVKYPSNWELGAARASSVVKHLIELGMLEHRFRATSYSDTQPIDSNQTKEGRQKNRRVSLLLKMPKLTQLSSHMHDFLNQHHYLN